MIFKITGHYKKKNSYRLTLFGSSCKQTKTYGLLCNPLNKDKLFLECMV